MMTQAQRLLLQIRRAVSTDRLHKIRRHSHQQTHFIVSTHLFCFRKRGVLEAAAGFLSPDLVSTRQ
jgi:hypothetical protein